MRLVTLPAAQGPIWVNPEAVAMLVPDETCVWLHLIGVGDKSYPIYLPVWKIVEALGGSESKVVDSDPAVSMLEASARLALSKAAEICEQRAIVTGNEAVRTMALDLAQEIRDLDPKVASA